MSEKQAHAEKDDRGVIPGSLHYASLDRDMWNRSPAEINQADATTPGKHSPALKHNCRIPQACSDLPALSSCQAWSVGQRCPLGSIRCPLPWWCQPHLCLQPQGGWTVPTSFALLGPDGSHLQQARLASCFSPVVGWKMAPKDLSMLQSLEPVNVPFFGKRVVAVVTKDLEMRRMT